MNWLIYLSIIFYACRFWELQIFRLGCINLIVRKISHITFDSIMRRLNEDFSALWLI